jgi:diguanylate cyclase (GGDEF)-like protein
MQEQQENIKRFRKALFILLAFASVLFIGWVRFLTGPEFAFSLLYLFPIIIVTWMIGLRWGILISLVSTASWLWADLSMIDRFSNSMIPLVNESFRLVVFLLIVFMIANNRKIMKDLEALALQDYLTGTFNRRGFYQLAQVEINRSRRYGHPFSVMMIDLDKFKAINDHLGHQVGDHLLMTVAETIKQHVRTIDIVARLGGDEFVVLLVKADEKTASVVSKKLKNQLLKIMQKKRWPVTFSIGVATYPLIPDTVDEMIKVADELMYQVKHNGKNDVRCAVVCPKSSKE